MSRRRFLRGLGVLGLSAGAGAYFLREQKTELLRLVDEFQSEDWLPVSQPAEQRRSRSRNDRPARKPVDILPHEKSYAEYLENLDLRYISPREVIVAHRRQRKGVSNELPPKRLWKRIAPTLKAADELRHRLGSPVSITSAYRSPAYNRQCPGAASRSFHTKNRALDLVYDCGPVHAMKEAKRMRREGLFQGGLGVYRSFIHLDTRGRNATWG